MSRCLFLVLFSTFSKQCLSNHVHQPHLTCGISQGKSSFFLFSSYLIFRNLSIPNTRGKILSRLEHLYTTKFVSFEQLQFLSCLSKHLNQRTAQDQTVSRYHYIHQGVQVLHLLNTKADPLRKLLLFLKKDR